MRFLIAGLLLAVSAPSCSCSPEPTRSAVASDVVPMSCGGGCTTSGECQGVGRCNYCYLGKCSEILPAQPIPPSDAGVDAMPSGVTLK